MTVSSGPPSPTLFWLHNLGLCPADEFDLMNGEWLTDNHVNAAQKLRKRHHPNQNGLEDPLMLSKWQSKATQFVQIVNLGRAHWVCVSSVNCPPGIVAYDSFQCILL